MDFDNSKLNYATIIFDNRVIKGECSYWAIDKSCGYLRLVIKDKEYLVGIDKVLLEEMPNYLKKEPNFAE